MLHMYTCAHLRSIVHAFYIQHTYIHILYSNTHLKYIRTYIIHMKHTCHVLHTYNTYIYRFYEPNMVWSDLKLLYTHRHTRVTGPCSAQNLYPMVWYRIT